MEITWCFCLTKLRCSEKLMHSSVGCRNFQILGRASMRATVGGHDNKWDSASEFHGSRIVGAQTQQSRFVFSSRSALARICSHEPLFTLSELQADPYGSFPNR